MKKTIIVASLTALLVNFLCAYPILLFIGIWIALGRLAQYIIEEIDNHDAEPLLLAWCYIIPVVFIPTVIVLELHRFYDVFPTFPRFRSPIYFKKEE